MTDLIKYRVKTKNIDDKHCKAGFKNHLKKELEYIDPKLIFVFSSNTWDTIKEKIDIEPIDDKVDVDNVASNHGYLFRTNHTSIDTYIIPLTHFSMVSYSNTLRNSYFDYLKEGIKTTKNK